jgi:hypothetical protein
LAFPVLAHFSPQACFGQCHRYRILVHVKADMVIDFAMTLLCMRLGTGPSGTTLEACIL